MGYSTEAEQRLVSDIQVLIERHDCTLDIRPTLVRETSGRPQVQMGYALSGPGICIHLDAELVQAVASKHWPIEWQALSPVEKAEPEQGRL